MKWFVYILFILFIGSVFFLFGFAQHRHNSHRINKVSITFDDNNATFLNPKIVDKLLIQSEGNPLNQLNSTINLHLIEQRLQKNEMVENAVVFVGSSGQLNIEIKQRKPIVRIVNNANSFYMDDKGLTMPLSPNFSERVPLATGIYGTKMEEELFTLMQVLRNDEFFKKQIIGIQRMPNGDFEFQIRHGSHKIIFGKPENMESKLNAVKVFYKKMWNDKKLNTYNSLNLKYKNQVVCSY